MTAPHIEAVTFLAGEQLPRALIEDVLARTSARLAVPCRLHVETWDAHAARLDGRDQFDADSLLLSLDATGAPGTIRIGLTAHDLGLALFTFVFGRAKKNGRAAIVSLARLDPGHYGLPPDPELYASRAVAEVMHELGHVAGLAHCGDMGCIMYFATNVETIDLRGTGFCTACAGNLPENLVRRDVRARSCS
jgi:archaemetzincin